MKKLFAFLAFALCFDASATVLTLDADGKVESLEVGNWTGPLSQDKLEEYGKMWFGPKAQFFCANIQIAGKVQEIVSIKYVQIEGCGMIGSKRNREKK